MKSKFLFLLALLLSLGSNAQEFPPLDSSIQFLHYDFESIFDKKAFARPNESLMKLKVMQEQSFREGNLYNIVHATETTKTYMDAAGLENDEYQRMFNRLHSKFASLQGPSRNVYAMVMLRWLRELEYRDIIGFDDESILWYMPSGPIYLKNYSLEPLQSFYKNELLQDELTLMKIPASQVYDSAQVLFKPTLYDLLVDEYLLEYDFTVDYNLFKVKTSDLLTSDKKHYNILGKLEQLNASNGRWNEYAYRVLNRLENAGVSFDSTSLKERIYQQYEKELSQNPASSLFSLELAGMYGSLARKYHFKDAPTFEEYNVKALSKIDQALRVHPISNWSNSLINLRDEIVKPFFGLEIQTEWLPKQAPLLRVNYANCEEVYLTILKIDGGIEGIGTRELNPLKSFEIGKKSEQKLDLNDRKKHLAHSKDFLLSPLKETGYYLFLLTDKAGEWERLQKVDTLYLEKNLAYRLVYVSNISVEQSTIGDEVLVKVNAKSTGKPIRKAKVVVTDRLSKEANRYTTDANGLARFRISKYSEIQVIYGKDSTEGNVYKGYQQEMPEKRIEIFTDRFVYRPGQIIQGKIIALGKEKTIANEAVVLELKDQNDQVVQKLNLTTNDFGSASFTFVLPKTGVLQGPHYFIANGGYTNEILVEEYKRPTFQVIVDEPKGKTQMNSPLILSGKVKAYAGYPIANAEVKVTVSERRFFPRWCIVSYQDSQYDTTISLRTNEQGEFNLSYLSQNTKESYGIYYEFSYQATDITGESQFANNTIYLGKRDYNLSIDAPELIRLNNKDLIQVRVTNAQNILQKEVEVSYVLNRISEKTWSLGESSEPEFKDFSEKEWAKKRPHYRYADANRMLVEIGKGTTKSGENILLNYPAILPGRYELLVSIANELGEITTEKKIFSVVDLQTKKNQHAAPFWTTVLDHELQMGDTAKILIGSSEKRLKVFVNYANETGLVRSEYIKVKKRKLLEIPMTAEWKKGVNVYISLVQPEGNWSANHFLKAADSTETIQVHLLTTRDTLLPGSNEKWEISLKNSGINFQPEYMVGMYDASLNVFGNHSWNDDFKFQPSISPNWRRFYHNGIAWNSYNNRGGFGFDSDKFGLGNEGSSGSSINASLMRMRAEGVGSLAFYKSDELVTSLTADQIIEPVQIRSNFSETAFFYPQLYPNEKGEGRFEFVLPDALTEWKFQALVHTKELKTGYLTKNFIAQKSLLLESYEPRFLRIGDSISWRMKVVNLSNENLTTKVELQLNDALTQKDWNNLLREANTQNVSLKPGETKEIIWNLVLPQDAPNLLTYVAKAISANHTDALSRTIPVVSNREIIRYTENKVVQQAGKTELNWELNQKMGPNAELISASATVQTNHSLLALSKLVRLLTPKDELTETIFYQFYAAILAQKILQDMPELRSLLDKYADEHPRGNLNMDEELKMNLLTETPWLLQGKEENEILSRLSILCSANALKNLRKESEGKLREIQLETGAWSWIGKQSPNYFITQRILMGMTELMSIGIEMDKEWMKKSMQPLDYEYKNRYSALNDKEKERELGLDGSVVEWLYIRALLNVENNEITQYFSKLAQKNWVKLGVEQYPIVGRWALLTQKKELAQEVFLALEDRKKSDVKMGVYWVLGRSANYSYGNNSVDLHTQILQFYREMQVNNSSEKGMLLWLNQQNKSSEINPLRSIARMTTAIAKTKINSPTSSTNVYWTGENQEEIVTTTSDILVYPKKSILSSVEKGVTIERTVDTPVFVDLAAVYSVPSSEAIKSNGDLRLEKNVYKLEKGKEILLDKNTTVHVGDILVIKLKIVANKNFSYLHLVDKRFTGMEPKVIESGYRFDGVMHYFVPKDQQTDFFIEYLSKGTANISYQVVVSNSGSLQFPPAQVQSYYDPNYTANSTGMKLTVR